MAKKGSQELFRKLVPSHTQSQIGGRGLHGIFDKFFTHSDAVHVSGNLGGAPSSTPVRIEAERDVNNLCPVFYSNAGVDYTAKSFTEVVDFWKEGIGSLDKDWATVSRYALSLPIDYDKLANFYAYYWAPTVVGASPTTSNPNLLPDYITIERTSTVSNDWQQGNAWVHGDKLVADGHSLSNFKQAQRPIIEYDAGLQLNTFLNVYGKPDDAGGLYIGTSYTPQKTSLNQAPLFDLYGYDGTHAWVAAPIIDFKRDQSAAIDPVLGIRCVLDDRNEHILSVQVETPEGLPLFTKENGAMRSFLHQSNTTPVHATATTFVANGVQLQSTTAAFNTVFANTTPTSTWHIDAVKDDEGWLVSISSPTCTASTSSRLMPIVIEGVLTVDTNPAFTNFSQSTKITQTTSVIGVCTSVPVDSEGMYDPSSPILRTHEVARVNPRNDPLSNDFSYSDLCGHLRSVLASQPWFTGSVFSSNNHHLLKANINKGLGGLYASYSSNIGNAIGMALAGVTIDSIVNHAISNYTSTLASIDAFVNTSIGTVFSSAKAGDTTDTLANKALTLWNNTRTKSKRNSKSGINGLLPTSVELGLSPLTTPTTEVDLNVSDLVIVHHDGHKSSAAASDPLFTLSLCQTPQTVSIKDPRNNTTTTVSTNHHINTTPSFVFNGCLRYTTDTDTLEVAAIDFNVYDPDMASSPLSATDGTIVFNSFNSIAYKKTGTTWAPTSVEWVTVNIAELRNTIVLKVEQRIAAACLLPCRIDHSSVEDNEVMANAFYSFCAARNLIPTASDYTDNNPFTWNYSEMTVSGLSSTPARWNTLYSAYTKAMFGQSTPRPDAEPWKLLGYATKPAWFESTYGGKKHTTEGLTPLTTIVGSEVAVDYVVDTAVNLATMKAGSSVSHKLPSGVETIVLKSGDIVLIVAQQDSSNNCLVRVNATGLEVLGLNGLYVQVKNAAQEPLYFGSVWTQVDGALAQVRRWSFKLWKAVQLYRPSAKRMVDIVSDELLPPYTPSGLRFSADSLFNSEPALKDLEYAYGMGGPAETLFRRSIEHLSARIKVIGRSSPLITVAKMWSDNLIFKSGAWLDPSGGGIRQLDGSTCKAMPHPNFISRWGVSSDATYTFTCIGRSLNGSALFTTQDGAVYSEGSLMTSEVSGITDLIRIEDYGYPFNVGDVITVSKTSKSITPTQTLHHNGLGCWFAAMAEAGVVSKKQVKAMTEWDVSIGHRFGGVIDPSSLNLSVGGNTLSPSDYKVITVKNLRNGVPVFTALRAQVAIIGTGQANSNGNLTPTPSHDDWVYLLSSVVGATSIEVGVVIDNGESFTVDNGDAWTHPICEGVATLKLPALIRGTQNLINTLFSYGDHLEQSGYTVPAGDRYIDSSTGQWLGWQSEIERLINTLSRGVSAGDGIVVNPYIKGLTITHENGVLTNLADAQGTRCLDVDGKQIQMSWVSVERTDTETTVESQVPIFGMEPKLTDYESVLMVRDRVRTDAGFSITIYDQLSGYTTQALTTSFTCTPSFTHKPSIQGFTHSIDGVVSPNIETNVQALVNNYDVNSDDCSSAKAILGFVDKEYFNALGISPQSQFGFMRKAIRAKGSNATVSAFGRISGYDGASLSEVWAFKLADFGGVASKPSEINVSLLDTPTGALKLQVGGTAIPGYINLQNQGASRWSDFTSSNGIPTFNATQRSETFAVKEGVVRLATPFMSITSITQPPGWVCTALTTNTVLCTKTSTDPSPRTATVNGATLDQVYNYTPIKLINKTSGVAHPIEIWHPSIGIHTSEALSAINYLSENDPAVYTTATSNAFVSKSWGASEVGTIWFNTSTVDYKPYTTSGLRWGAATDNSTFEVNEWVESDVPPTEFAGSTINGYPSQATIIKHTRSLQQAPVAWSYLSNGGDAHPAFGDANSNLVLYVGDNTLTPDYGRCADYGLTAGRMVASFAGDFAYPTGQVQLTDLLSYALGTYSTTTLPSPTFETEHLSITPKLTPTAGQVIGAVTISSRANTISITTEDGYTETQTLSNIPVNETTTLTFATAGIALRISPISQVDTTTACSEISSALSDLFIRECVSFTNIIAIPSTSLCNNPLLSPTTDIPKWGVYDTPTQAQLDADQPFPYNQWKPYVGVFSTVGTTTALLGQLAAPLVLKDGSTINSIQSVWDTTTALHDETQDALATEPSTLFSTSEAVSSDRIQILANGSNVPRSLFSIDGTTVSVDTSSLLGQHIRLVKKAYNPSTTELSFDINADDFKTMVYYSKVYPHSTRTTRLPNGLVKTLFYFWVKGRATRFTKNKLPTTQISALLRKGPDMFATIGNPSGGSFTTITIHGIQPYLTTGDKMALRFKSDKSPLLSSSDNSVKNTHSVWATLHPQQSTPIPQQLWELITNTLCGQAIDGTPLPSPAVEAYDNLNGTSQRFGFEDYQVLIPSDKAVEIVVAELLNAASSATPETVGSIDYNNIYQSFSTPASTRATMDTIRSTCTSSLINSIVFAVIDEAVVYCKYPTKLMKTSFISVKSAFNV